ncbi:MAG: transposase [Candidatus Zixiibacteriota bacterium]
MSKLKRYNNNGNIYFVTNVTNNRNTILIDNSTLLYDTLNDIESRYNVILIAWVLLPDHFHLLIDTKDYNLSDLMQKIKLSFSKKYRFQLNVGGQIWQKRFWDHIIRNQLDMNAHIDYIHYNPVKHGYVKKPIDWKHSSFHKYLEEGFYNDDWGVKDQIEIDGNFGE